MARPKKADKDEMATVKIENAFWRLLEKGSYSEITVLRISQESRTNRNSFYYHYRDIEDLAYQAFRHVSDSGASRMLLSALLSTFQGNPAGLRESIDSSVMDAAKHVMLYAGSDSAFLKDMVSNLLKETWFEALAIREDQLTEIEKLQVRFIFAGLVATLGSDAVQNDPDTMPVLSQTEIGRSVIKTMKDISEKRNG